MNMCNSYIPCSTFPFCFAKNPEKNKKNTIQIITYHTPWFLITQFVSPPIVDCLIAPDKIK